HFKSALQFGPADVDTVFNLADTCVALGRCEDALSLLQNPPAMDKRQEEEAEFSAMIEQIRDAMAKGAVDGARLIEARERNIEGEKLLRAGQAEQALAVFQAILREDAGDFRALNNLGLAQWYLGNGQEAWDAFAACLAIRPCWT